VIDEPRCTKIRSEHEARTQAVEKYRIESHRRISLLLQPPVYLIVVDHKTSTQITHFWLTSHHIILTYQLYYPLLKLQQLFLQISAHCRGSDDYSTSSYKGKVGSIPGQCIWDLVAINIVIMKCSERTANSS